MSDPGEILATPLIIIQRKIEKQDIENVLRIVKQEGVGRIIVGLPISLSGYIGEQAQKVRKFAELLIESTSISVEMRDERFSTVTARNLIREARTKKSPKRQGKEKHDDAIAAAVILQEYLDQIRQKPSESL